MTTFGELAQKWSGDFRTSFHDHGVFVMEGGVKEGGVKEIWTFSESKNSFPFADSEMQQEKGLTHRNGKHRTVDYYYNGAHIGTIQYPMNGIPESLWYVSVWGVGDDSGEARFTDPDAALRSLLKRNNLPDYLALSD